MAVIKEYTRRIAEEMHVRGLMNMQYAIENNKVYVLEANPRASRTVPLVSKVCNIRMVPLATEIITADITGRPSPVPQLKEQAIPRARPPPYRHRKARDTVAGSTCDVFLSRRGSEVMVLIGAVDVKLEDAAEDEGHDGRSAEPPCGRYACDEA